MEMCARRARPLLGTVVAIEIDSGASGVDHSAAFNAAFEAVARVHRSMSFHSATSDLSRLNRAEIGAVLSVDPWFVEVVRVALDLYRLSVGAFDPGIAPALVRSGVLPAGMGEGNERGSSISAFEVIDDGRLVKRAKSCIDLGGIAKGFAVDVAVRALREHGVGSGVVNAGGDLRVFGSVARSVVIRHPVESGRIRGAFELQAMACCSSVSEGVAPNCVDPRDGSSLRKTIAATVLAPKAVWADGLTKIAILEGSLSDEMVRVFGARLLYREVFDGAGTVWLEGERACA